MELEFTTGPGSHVVVYRMKPFASTWQALAATRDGAPVAPVLSTYNMDVFASAGTSGSQWRIRFETDAPQWVDVYAF